MILVGEDPASQLYVRNKTKDCEECGYLSRRFDLPADTSEEILLGIINKLNRDSKIDGILVQLPLPPQINEKSIIEAIAPEKDVDAFHPVNVGRMVRGDALVWPCTPSFGSVLIGIILLIFANRKDMTNPYIVVLSCDGHESEEKAIAYLKEKTKRCSVKSKTARKGSVELNLEIRLQDDNTDFINELSELPGVDSAVLVSYNGDYMG